MQKMETTHFLSRFQATVLKMWDEEAMTDIDGTADYKYSQVANQIEKMHAQFKAIGLKEGDKIALCGRNCAAWAITFLAISTYKAVAVSILPDFTSEKAKKRNPFITRKNGSLSVRKRSL